MNQLFKDTNKSAMISNDKNYRYNLKRIWNESKSLVGFLMLNPSTADANFDDPTIRRCIAFAKSWGYGGISVCNLFAWRESNPEKLLFVSDPVGTANLYFLEEMATECDIIICAWGNSALVKRLHANNKSYMPLKNISHDKLYYLELSQDGTPKHPLYLKGDIRPIKYEIQSCKIQND